MLHTIWWTIRHAELLILLGVPTIAWLAVITEPATAADVTQEERP